MLRLTLMLCAAIYAGLVIFSEQAPETAAPATAAPAIGVTRAGAIYVTAPRQSADALVTADGRVLPIAAMIDPAALDDRPGTIAGVSTRRQDTAIAAAVPPAPATEVPLVEVTGNQVNLRAGPSTGDAVLGALVRGERAELIAATGDGWVQIRAVSSGTVGFMADRFIAPLN